MNMAKYKNIKVEAFLGSNSDNKTNTEVFQIYGLQMLNTVL